MYRSPDDIALLTELAGVLDETVAEAGLTSGTYLVLREVTAATGPVSVRQLADRLGADADEVAELAGRLAQQEFVAVRATGLESTPVAVARVRDVETRANEAIRAYVMERAHSPTVYGLVAAMQTGRFTVVDLIEFINAGADDDDARPPE